MLNKTIIVLTVFIVGLMAISTVSAQSDTAEDIVSTDDINNAVESTEESTLDSSAKNNGLLNKKDNDINEPASVDMGSYKLKMDSGQVLGEEIHVTGDSFTDIEKAINESSDGDIIYLKGGYYTGNQSISINKNLTILGGFEEGDGKYAILDARHLNRIFQINAQVTLHGIKFINGNTTDNGGAIYVNKDCTLIDCIFTNNRAMETGGAVHWGSGSVGINNCTFENNSASFGGANFFDYKVTNVSLTGNFINNTATLGGANFFIREVTNVSLTGNFINNAAGSGGANFFDYKVTNVSLTGNFINNAAGTGSANFFSNIFDFKKSAITNVTLTGNYINNGGRCVIYIRNSVSGNVIHDSIFINNAPIVVESGRVSVCDVWFGNNVTNYNVAPYGGKGIVLSNWLFLNATADSNSVSIENATNIRFKLSRYDGENISEYDNSCLLPVNLTVNSTLGSVNSKHINLEESIAYTPNCGGKGCVTASIENVFCTIEIENQKLEPELSIEYNPSLAGEITYITVTLPSDAEGNVSVIDTGGNKYTGIVQTDGIAVVEVYNLPAGDNKLNIIYSGDKRYLNKTVGCEVHVDKMPTFLDSKTVEMYVGDGTKYKVYLLDKNENPIKGMRIKVSITGKIYTIITDENGMAMLPINLKPDIYSVTAVFDGNRNYIGAVPVSTKVFVMTKVRIDQHKDMTKDYGNSDKFIVHAVDKYGKSVGAYAKVKMTMVGKTYTVYTDKHGYASLAINLKPGTYDITCEYAGYTVKHKVTVKQVLSATNRQYKKAASYQFTATLKYSNGKAISGKTVTFTFKGKTYTQTTNTKGEATITIKETLNLGKYNIMIKYIDYALTKSITIK